LLGVLMISLVAFQFFYRNKIVLVQENPVKENIDVGLPH
jgi:hypothetical protein